MRRFPLYACLSICFFCVLGVVESPVLALTSALPQPTDPFTFAIDQEVTAVIAKNTDEQPLPAHMEAEKTTLDELPQHLTLQLYHLSETTPFAKAESINVPELLRNAEHHADPVSAPLTEGALKDVDRVRLLLKDRGASCALSANSKEDKCLELSLEVYTHADSNIPFWSTNIDIKYLVDSAIDNDITS